MICTQQLGKCSDEDRLRRSDLAARQRLRPWWSPSCLDLWVRRAGLISADCLLADRKSAAVRILSVGWPSASRHRIANGVVIRITLAGILEEVQSAARAGEGGRLHSRPGPRCPPTGCGIAVCTAEGESCSPQVTLSSPSPSRVSPKALSLTLAL